VPSQAVESFIAGTKRTLLADERAVRGRGWTDAPTLDRMSLVPVDETITKALARVPVLAGREVDVSVLAGGFTNSVFLVRADDERYVFRVPGQSSDLLEINRADERYNAEIAARAGASPDLVDYVEGMDVMVLEFIEGHVPTIEDLQTPRSGPKDRRGGAHPARRTTLQQ